MLKVLVIEDEEAIGQLLIDMLEKNGHSVDWAKDGVEGEELYRKNSYDLITLDVTMPRMDGLELARVIRREPFGFLTPIIILSASHSLKDKIKGLALGADEYLPKPFYVDSIINRIPIVLEYKKEKLSDSHIVELPSYSRLEKRFDELKGSDVLMVYTNITNYYSRVTEYTNEFMLMIKNIAQILSDIIPENDLFHLDGPNFCFFVDNKSSKKKIKKALTQFKKMTSSILKTKEFISYHHMVAIELKEHANDSLKDLGPLILELLQKLTRPGNYALHEKIKIIAKK